MDSNYMSLILSFISISIVVHAAVLGYFSLIFKKKDDCLICREKMAEADRIKREKMIDLINKKAESDRVQRLEDSFNTFSSSLATMEANIEFIKKALEK